MTDTIKLRGQVAPKRLDYKGEPPCDISVADASLIDSDFVNEVKDWAITCEFAQPIYIAHAYSGGYAICVMDPDFKRVYTVALDEWDEKIFKHALNTMGLKV